METELGARRADGDSFDTNNIFERQRNRQSLKKDKKKVPKNTRQTVTRKAVKGTRPIYNKTYRNTHRDRAIWINGMYL